MGWTPAQLPDLDGYRVIVTGANSGIGFDTALELARHGAIVTLACRNVEKATAAADRIRRLVGAGAARGPAGGDAVVGGAAAGGVEVAELDLGRLDSVCEFADRWPGPLDLLINNAGVMAPLRRRQTVDGFELQMGTNHLGHFALTGRLLPALLQARRPRVVTVASLAHTSGRLDLDDLQSVSGYAPQRSYGNSKLANLLFASELQRRADAAGSRLTSTAAHPGLAATGLVTNPDGLAGNPIMRLIAPVVVRIISQSAAAGAVPTLYAATAGAPGSYTGPQSLRESRGAPAPARRSEAAQDVALAGELWTASEQLTGVHFDWSLA